MRFAMNFVVKSQKSFAASTPGDLSLYSWQLKQKSACGLLTRLHTLPIPNAVIGIFSCDLTLNSFEGLI
jgi:hypothetical protein